MLCIERLWKPEVWSDQHWEEQRKTVALRCTNPSGKPKAMTDWDHVPGKTQSLRFELFNSFDILVIADLKPPNRQLTSPDPASKDSKQLLNFEWTVNPEKNFFAHNQLRCFSHSNSTLAKSDFKLPSCARQSLRMQQTGEIHRNPSTSESNAPNGARWAGSLPHEVSFKHLCFCGDHQSSVKLYQNCVLTQIATCQASKLVKPGDMQSSTQDIYGFRWKKWIREIVGRLRPGSPLACGMKNSVKYLAEKKMPRSSLFNPNPETTTHVLHSRVYCTLLKCLPTFHAFYCWLSSQI